MASSSSTEPKVLVVGGDGLIGRHAAARYAALGIGIHATTRKPELAGRHRPFFDLGQPSWPDIADRRYPQVLLAAGQTGLNACHSDPEGSRLVNVTHTCMFAATQFAQNSHLLFLSSSQVFDGRKPFPAPDWPPAPVTIYGSQKTDAEHALMRLQREIGKGRLTILRLSKVLHPVSGLIRHWHDRLWQGLPVTASANMMVSPIDVGTVIDAILLIFQNEAEGILHLSATDEISYFALARYIADRLGVSPALVRPGSDPDLPLLIEKPPVHSVLESGRLAGLGGLMIPTPWQAIDKVLFAMQGTR